MTKTKLKFSIILFFSVIIVLFGTTYFLQAQEIQADQPYATQYFSPDEIKRVDSLVEFLSSTEVVYSVLVSFSLLVVIVTYFIIVGIIVVLFFRSFL